ncbi:MAG: type II secretion system F family protein [Phycisphaerae bacterium]
MATFNYIVRKPDGEEQQGVLVAENESAALRSLGQQGLFPLKVWQDDIGTSSFRFTRRIRLSELSNFYHQLADLLRAGVPILRSLDVLSRQDQRRAISGIIKELREDVTGGVTLADAMEKHTYLFPELHVGMVRAGEQGGFIEPVLRRLAGFVDQKDQLRNKVIGSMIYPAFLLFIGFTVVLVMTTYFLPKLEPLFSGEKDLPAITQIVMGFGKVIQAYYLPIIFGFILLGTLIVPYLRSENGIEKWQKLQLHIPVVGKIFRMVAICRFCRIFGTLLANGVPMINSLNISRDSAGNIVLANVIGESAESVRAGKGLAKALLESNLFPIDIVDMIAVAEETNRLAPVLVEIADTQEQRLTQKIDVAVRMIEPLMLLVVFGMVFVIALAVLLPIMQISMGAGGKM